MMSKQNSTPDFTEFNFSEFEPVEIEFEPFEIEFDFSDLTGFDFSDLEPVEFEPVKIDFDCINFETFDLVDFPEWTVDPAGHATNATPKKKPDKCS